ncbi:hypothetical protein HYFRA_00009747 [Hymenoscyphus fraxineus]|uniref:Uncharacterized protein n=1 Tax=Hymenoscyphus fraxineus TaxID=746836 RepID=A0A9N9PR07_9HELO|nr:hypothetical protein HYFRA_00009747 [Hymenoscyphus fraxineus]
MAKRMEDLTEEELRLITSYEEGPSDGPEYPRHDYLLPFPKIRHLTDPSMEPYEKLAAYPKIDGKIDERAKELISHEVIRLTERELLKTFSVPELQSAGCFADDTAQPSNLQFPIHPLYQKKKWPKSEQPILIDHDNPTKGSWDVHNPNVWSVIEPALRLASAMLDLTLSSSWLNGLLAGEWEKVDETDLYLLPTFYFPELIKYGAYLWRRRKAQNDQETKEESIRRINMVMDRIDLNFGYHGANLLGYTACLQDPAEAHITMSLTASAPLMDNTLTVAERNVQEAAWAFVLVHETMHALSWTIHAVRPDINLLIPRVDYPKIGNPKNPGRKENGRWLSIDPEPFFEQEEIAEVGHSWEAMIFGGGLNPINENIFTPFVPWLGFMFRIWPTSLEFNRQKDILQRVRNKNNIKDRTSIWYPIPTKFSEWMGQQEFWDVYVGSRGVKALHPPRILGVSMDRGSNNIRIYGPEAKYWVPDEDVNKARALPPAPLYASEADKWLHNDLAMTRENTIKATLWQEHETQRLIQDRLKHVLQKQKFDIAMEAYQESDFYKAHQQALALGVTDMPKYNLLRDVLLYAMYDRAAEEKYQEQAIEYGKRAKELFFEWVDLDKKWVTGKREGPDPDSYVRTYNPRLDPLYGRISEILAFSKHLDNKELTGLSKNEATHKKWVVTIEKAVWRMDYPRKFTSAMRVLRLQNRPPVFELDKPRRSSRVAGGGN